MAALLWLTTLVCSVWQVGKWITHGTVEVEIVWHADLCWGRGTRAHVAAMLQAH